MIYKNNFDTSICESYLPKIESDMIVFLKAYESNIDGSEKLNNELTKLRLRFEDLTLKIN